MKSSELLFPSCTLCMKGGSIFFSFGYFTSKYLKGQFFLDVHPPLAKLLFTLVAWLMGFDGEFEFSYIGESYEPEVPYVAMRLLPAVCGVLTVCTMFLTLKASGCRSFTATLGAALIFWYVMASSSVLLLY